MLVARVSDRDRPIGAIARDKVFVAKANFRVVHAWIFDSAGRLLLQKIPINKERHGGQWGSSVAGYVKAGERYPEALRRKLREEIGTAALPTGSLGKSAMHDEGALKFIHLYRVFASRRLQPNPEDFADHRFVTKGELEALRASDAITPTLAHLLDAFPEHTPAV